MPKSWRRLPISRVQKRRAPGLIWPAAVWHTPAMATTAGIAKKKFDSGVLIRIRYALPIMMLLTGSMLWINEDMYDDTTDALKDGIALTDNRISSARLLQLLTDAEVAEQGFVLTGNSDYQARFVQAQQELPSVQAEVTQFLSGLGAAGDAQAKSVAAATANAFSRVGRSIELARSGDMQAASRAAQDPAARQELMALRSLLQSQLKKSTIVQRDVRVSIFNTLKLGRMAVGTLTIVSFLSILLLLYQVRRQDKDRSKERKRLEAEVVKRTARITELARHFQSVREDERTFVARELHDELGALLTVSKLEIARAKSKADKPDEILASLARVSASLDKGIALKRRIIEGLTPSALKHLGLPIALENLCRDMSKSLGVPVALTPCALDVSPIAQLAVYRFVQEALTNIGKYAEATSVSVGLRVVTGQAMIEVQDNGVGFDNSDSTLGRHDQHGLAGMRFRAESLGGLMSVDTSPGRGTTLRLEFPQAQV